MSTYLEYLGKLSESILLPREKCAEYMTKLTESATLPREKYNQYVNDLSKRTTVQRAKYNQYMKRLSATASEHRDKYAESMSQYVSKMYESPLALHLQASWANYRLEIAGRLPTFSSDPNVYGGSTYGLFLFVLLVPGLISWVLSDKPEGDSAVAMTHETWHVFLVSALLVIGVVQLSRYYTAHCIETPRVDFFPTPQNTAVMERFREHIRDYAPTPWALSGHINSFLFAYWPLSIVFGLKTPVVEERELVAMDDGGVVALDWFNHRAVDERAPVFVVLPGVVGKWDNSYIKRLVLEAQAQGWRPVCKSYRGIGVPMSTAAPETWSSVTTQDFNVCLQRIRRKYRDAPILVTGFSVGGLQVLSYQGDPRRTIRLAGAVAISGIFDSAEVYTHGLEPHRLPPYDFALFASLATDMQTHWGTLGGHVGQDLAAVFKSSPWKFYTWHKHVTTHVPINGKTYSGDVEAYFHEVGAYHRECLACVEDPVLCFHARDDPLVPDTVGRTALDIAAQAKGPIIIETNRGGHCGWFEGWLGESWVDGLTIEYLKASLEVNASTT